MSGKEIVDYAVRFFHLGGVILLVGGLAYWRFVLLPALAELEDEARAALQEKLLGRFRIIVHGAVGLVFLTGLYNTMVAFPNHKGQPLYHSLYGLKFLLGLTVFAFVSIMVGRRSTAERMRAKASFWLTLLLLLALAIIALTYVLRLIPVQTA